MEANKTDVKKQNNDKQKELKKMVVQETYIDYDFSKMHDTKGGFLIEQETLDKVKPVKMVEIKNEGNAMETRCKECNKLGIDALFLQLFNTAVCDKCKKEIPDKYSLLTKTEVKEDYLLTEDELRDKELFQCWSKPNPRKSSWNNMLLYLREQVETYAYKKWGGPEGLDAELDRRDNLKKKKKETKFKGKLKELRKRTRTDQWQNQRVSKVANKKHDHRFVSDENGSRCDICGLEVEMETI